LLIGGREASALEADEAEGLAADPALTVDTTTIDDLEAEVEDGLGDGDDGILDFDKGKTLVLLNGI